MHTTVTTADMSTRALDAITIVEAAKMFALPIPFDVSFSRHELRAAVHTLGELTAWALHMGADVTKGTVLFDGRRHFYTRGTLAGAEVTLSVIAHQGGAA